MEPSLLKSRCARALAALALLLAVGAGVRAQTVTLEARVTGQDGQPVEDAVVVAMPVDATALAGARPHAEIVDQIDKEFVPRVKPIYVGSSVTFPNKDNVRHHVYSFSAAKRFELPLYSGVPAQPVLFDKAGVVVLGCNIHDWMVGYIYVSDSPWFAKTGVDGKATLSLPARAYVLRVWHPQLAQDEATTRKPMEIAAGAPAHVAWTITLKPDVRVRRAPGGAHGTHY